jgi:hypothetical protein
MVKHKFDWLLVLKALLITLAVFIIHWLSDLLLIEKFAITSGFIGMIILFLFYAIFLYFTLLGMKKVLK